MALAGVVARLSRWLPLMTGRRRVLLRYLGPAVVSALAIPITATLAITCLGAMAATRYRPLVDAVRSHRWVLGGRVVTLAVVAVALPHAGSSLIDIATR